MNTVKKVMNKQELSIIERGVRNSVIWHLSEVGFTVNSIANVMSMTQSTVSRIISNKPERSKMIDTILWGSGLGDCRE